jgi:hypothetical protein
MAKPKPKPTVVYPVPGRYLSGVPHVAHDCTDPWCVESGAFTPQPPPTVAEPIPEGPPDGGPSDTTED